MLILIVVLNSLAVS